MIANNMFLLFILGMQFRTICVSPKTMLNISTDVVPKPLKYKKLALAQKSAC